MKERTVEVPAVKETVSEVEKNIEVEKHMVKLNITEKKIERDVNTI